MTLRIKLKKISLLWTACILGYTGFTPSKQTFKYVKLKRFALASRKCLIKLHVEEELIVLALLRTEMETKQKYSIFKQILLYKTIHLFLKHPNKKLFLKKGGKPVSYWRISK